MGVAGATTVLPVKGSRKAFQRLHKAREAAGGGPVGARSACGGSIGVRSVVGGPIGARSVGGCPTGRGAAGGVPTATRGAGAVLSAYEARVGDLLVYGAWWAALSAHEA